MVGCTVADLGGVKGVQMHPPLAASNVFCVHNCTSPSNDYAAVACSNNNQPQLHTHVSVSYWSPDVWLGLELLRDIQFGPRSPPRRASAYEISKSTGFHVDFGFQSGFLDFTVDFWIQFGFLDFSLDFCRQVSSCMFLDILVIVPSLAKVFS